MDMDGDDEHETDDTKITNGHKTCDLTVSGSGHRARKKSHTVMPPLVPDSKDGMIMIKPTGDM
jgi:hypothetical protein